MEAPDLDTSRESARRPGAWEILGRALLDYEAGDRGADLLVVHEDGEGWPLHAADFFRRDDALPAAEAAALELCRGRVLDVGAGAGCHALALQERGLEVWAIDVSPGAVSVMRRRGVRRAQRADVFAPELRGPWDTLLLMMNGIGLAGDLAGLDRFLDRAGELLADGGQVLFDSCDLRRIGDAAERRRIAERRRQGRYFGQTLQRISYPGHGSAVLNWLYVDSATLRRRARRRGWESQVVFEDAAGSFAARLVRR